MSVSTFNADEIDAMGRAVESAGGLLSGAPDLAAPPTSAFGKLLEPPATHTFPATTDGADAFVDQGAAAVASAAQALHDTATSYRTTEQNNVGLSNGAPGAATPAPRGDLTPKDHWGTATDILSEGASAGGDAFSGGNIAAIMVPAPLEWLNFPVAVSELVTTALGFLAATVISYFPPFNDALEQLTGDPEAVRAAKQAFADLASLVDEHITAMADAGTQAPNWTGPGANACADYLGVQAGCMRAAKAVIDLIGPSVEGVAKNTASARMMVTAALANVLDEIVRYVTPRLFWLKVALGFAAVPFGFIVTGAMLAGLVADFVAWVLEFLATEFQVLAQVMRDVAQQGTGYLGQVRQLGETLDRAGVVLQSGHDPGNGFGVDEGSMAESMLGTGQDDRDGLVLDLLADGPTEGNGFTEVTDPDELAALGLTPEMLRDDANGFAAHVMRHEDGTIVVQFEGTDFHDPAQKDLLLENVPGGTGMGPQSEMAMAIAQAVGDSDQQGNVIYAGHSLGGRLAAVAAATSGNPAITANAAGVSPAQLEYIAQQNGMTSAQLTDYLNSGGVRAYNTADDLLTGLQEDYPITPGLMPNAVGTQIDLDGSKDPVAGHDDSNVRDEYNRRYPDASRPGGFGRN